MKLSILIATTTDRRAMFESLLMEFNKQNELYKDEVEILFEEDNKELTIGAKRNILLKRATGEWIVFFDSDDYPFDYYIETIYNVIDDHTLDIDCIGVNIIMTTNNTNLQRCCHSLRYPQWKGDGRTKIDGWDYVRNITHFNPVRRELALRTGFKNIRFGEDRDYSDRLFPLLKKEYYIPYPLFHYRYSNRIHDNIKYGFTKNRLFR